MVIRLMFRVILRLIVGLAIGLSFLGALSAQKAHSWDEDPQMKGLPEITQEELTWQNKHMLRVKKVKLNKLGLERVNKWRNKKGLRPFSKEEAQVVEKGYEIEGTVGKPPGADPGADFPDMDSPQSDLPPYVDNSALKYFPPIRSQGSLPSCGAFSGTYYTMTHMFALARDLDVKNWGDDYIFSPKWTYNMVNGGAQNGSWYYWAYEIGMRHGSATWAEFPYDSNFRAWCLDPVVWRDAIDRRFDDYGYVANTNQDAGIEQVKQLLINGYVLNIPTYISSWKWKQISDDPAVAEDDAFVGKNSCFWVNGTSGYHGMTVVGYNDHVWVDINGNNQVDAGEKGAFRIANSWGSGWGEGGFCWMAYDALKNPSAVSGGPSDGRITGWSPARAHWVTATAWYEPAMVAEFTLNHAKRNQLYITLGVSDPSENQPALTWYPDMLYGQGGPYAFDGTTTACEATFVLDFSDIAPSGGDETRYHVGIYDNSAGDMATLENYNIIDVYNGNLATTCDAVPAYADAEQLYSYIDYYFSDGNAAPFAVANATPPSGYAPLSTALSGQGSYDSDGSIVRYDWDFGDGGTGTGMVVDHLYENPGTYTATLSVTDNMGGTSEDSVFVEVLADPSMFVFVESIDLSLNSVPGGIKIRSSVLVLNQDGNPVSGATVAGEWGGLIGGGISGFTGSDGTVTFTSRKTKKNGAVSFTVTGVSAQGYTYDPAQNTETEEWISTDQEANKAPVADIAVSPAFSGQAPFNVSLDGSGSYDPDGNIISFDWDFGDGTTGSGQTAIHTYENPGTYETVLTVTDDEGATGSDQVTISVTSDTLLSMYVRDIEMTVVAARRGNTAQARVQIHDQDGTPVAGATVSGDWSGLTRGALTGSTSTDGTVTFTSRKSKSSGDFVFTVTSVSAAGFVYEPGLNWETSDVITNQ